MSPFSSTVTKKTKQNAWEGIRTQLNDVGANIENIRTLRDVIWANIRRSMTKKMSEAKKTGAGGSGNLTELDETVLDILGRESANVEPVNATDTEVVFGGDSLPTEVIITTTLDVEGNAGHVVIECKNHINTSSTSSSDNVELSKYFIANTLLLHINSFSLDLDFIFVWTKNDVLHFS